MENGRKSGAKSWVICLSICAALSLAMLIGRGGFSAPDPTAFWHILCDALFVPGAVMFCAGLLVVCSQGGAFDAISYGVKKVFSLLQKPEKRTLAATYFDYVSERRARKHTAPWALLSVGGAFLLASGVALALYYGTLA